MTFKIIEVKEDKQSNNLPALYKCIAEGNNGEIVMFLSEECAFAVVAPPQSTWVIGEIGRCCMSCFKKDIWQRLPKGTEFIFTQD